MTTLSRSTLKDPNSKYRFAEEIMLSSPVVSMQIFKEQFTDYLEQLNFKDQLADYLVELEIADPEFTIRGASSHKYSFGPKLSESDILSFEKKHGCTLPKPYKTLLTEFGNGGAGPSNGIFALGKMLNGLKEEPWPDNVTPGAPFRFNQLENEDLTPVAKPVEKNFLNAEEYDEAYNIWEEVKQDQFFEEHGKNQGAIPICKHESDYTTWLVVDEDSPEYGNIYYNADNMGVEPDESRMGFAEWMLDWCTTSLQKLEIANLLSSDEGTNFGF